MDEPQWRKLSEQLPGDGDWCWVWYTSLQNPNGVLLMAQHTRRGACSYWWSNALYAMGYLDDGCITHWASLPPPTPPSQDVLTHQLFIGAFWNVATMGPREESQGEAPAE